VKELSTKSSIISKNIVFKNLYDVPAKKFLGINIHAVGMRETVDIIIKAVLDNRYIHQVAVNAFIFVLVKKDRKVKESVEEATLINADGQSVIWGSKLLSRRLPERVTGIDLMENLIDKAYKHNLKVFLLGAREEIVRKVVDVYSAKYSASIIAGYRNGYFKKEEEGEIVETISQSGAHMLFVAMGSPQKEIFLYENREKLKINYIMGVGGTFDVIAGKVSRAPMWMQKSGLEWFYRFLQEPKRMWKRYLITNSLFIYYVFKSLIGKFLKEIE